MEKKERDRFEDVVRLLTLEVRVKHESDDWKVAFCVNATPFNQEEINKLKQEALKLINIK